MRRFIVDTLPGPGALARLDESTSHHLLVVCRHPRDKPLIVFDGSGLEAEAELVEIQQGRAVLRLRSAPRPAAAHPERHLVLGLPKGPALDHALRMSVELGVTHIHPVLSARAVRRSDRGDRWRRILEGAARQCGRADVPECSPLTSLGEASSGLSSALERFVGVPGAPPLRPNPRAAALAVGPEGGFSPQELEQLLAEGWRPAGLGAWVLRTDTAVAAGLALLAPGAPHGPPSG